MGKTPWRAIEARRLKVTPALLAQIRHRYEHTADSLSSLAVDLGCDVKTVGNIAKREGWVRYQSPPRDLTPAMRLRARAEALADDQRPPTPEPVPPFAARTGGGDMPPAQHQVADTAQALHGELQGLLADVTAERLRMKREGFGKHDLREVSGVIANLGAVLRTLQPMLQPAQHSGSYDDYDDIPEDLDEFREALARKIEEFLASRPDEGIDELADGGMADKI